ncbi:Flagellar radial spoke protein 4 [Diplonema papillatum]|nr:Flagellar radial spoke protein 4 [Diplonema papillatum]
MADEKFLTSELAIQLSDILATVITEKPNDALGLFESLAVFSRTGKMVPDDDPTVFLGEESVSKAAITPEQMRSLAWAKQYSHLVVPPKPQKKAPKDDDEEAEPEPEEEEPEDKGELADVTREQEVFNSVGMGLPAAEAYRLMVSLKRLLDREPLKSVRFFGKIFGIRGDYHVAEAEVDPEREAEPAEEAGDEEADDGGKGPETILEVLNNASKGKQPPLPTEPKNNPGANKYQYYVTTDLVQWTKLPDVTPQHIQAARLIKKLFTGDLFAPVTGHPPFPGVEQHYLRAQIARINHACRLAPRGVYEDLPEEEEEDDEEAAKKDTSKRAPYETLPELAPAATEDLPEADDEQWQKEAFAVFGKGYENEALLDGKNWVHVEPSLLQTQGRTTEHKFEKEDGEDEGEEDAGPQPPLELVSPLLSQVCKDATLAFEAHRTRENASWIFRKAFAQTSSAAKQTYLVKSLRWPGACCFAQVQAGTPGASYCNAYFGNGLKAPATFAFSPPMPEARPDVPFKTPLLQTDYTPDDELEFVPPPPAPQVVGQDEEEEDNEEDQ